MTRGASKAMPARTPIRSAMTAAKRPISAAARGSRSHTRRWLFGSKW